ncbi:DUF998 domain-containing protein [Streptomyces sp. E11-3]|uniref:DUF998 domain-containing protein n=1 Tax=Streptomyces sp. E11-3 TaxID=3110112 RepID=UPI00397F9A5D
MSTIRFAALLLGLGAVAYSAWVIEGVVDTGLDPLRTYVSELAAQSQPLGDLFRAADLTAGLLVLAGALSAHRADRRADRRSGHWTTVGWAGLALFGAATALDSQLPLSCTPTADPACATREAAGLVPATHTAHAVSSALAVTGALIGMVALTTAARRYGRWAPLARTGPWLTALELAATAWTLASVAAFTAGRGTWLLGLGQRLQVLTIALWLAMLALALARSRSGTTAATEATEATAR